MGFPWVSFYSKNYNTFANIPHDMDVDKKGKVSADAAPLNHGLSGANGTGIGTVVNSTTKRTIPRDPKLLECPLKPK